MKIIHIVEPLATGIHSFLVDLTSKQCDDNEVYIAYGVRPLTFNNFKSYFDKRIHWIRVENFKMTLGINDLKAFFELKRIIKDINPDIIHCHSSISGFLGRIAADYKNSKVFYTPHGYSFLMKEGSQMKRFFYWFLEFIAAKSNSTTIACSKGEYLESKKLSKRCTYVNNGINILELNPYVTEVKKISQHPVVCTSGRILYQKNPFLFNKVAELLPNVRFIWIGEGELRKELIAKNIEITGWIDRKEVLKIIQSADFFLLPSLWEGLPISLLEGMYLKKVCLVSDVIGNRDVINNGINGFICDTPMDYAAKIQNCINEKIDVYPLSENAHQDVLLNYNLENMALQYYNIYTNNCN